MAMMDNDDQRHAHLYNMLRARHEYLAFVQHIEHTKAERDSVEAFWRIQGGDHDWDGYPYPPMTEGEVKSFCVG